MLIVNLALFDIVMLVELPWLILNSFAERILGWEVGCQIYAALGGISGIGCATTNAAIAYDRYK
jgi:r-opsin